MVEHGAVIGSPSPPGEPAEPPAPPDSLSHRDLKWLAAVVAIAALVRLVHVMCLTASPLFDSPAMDPGLHTEWARQIVAGTLPAEPYFRAPLYLYFVSAFFALLGDSWTTYLAIRIAQAGIGAASCGVLFLIGRRAYGRATGVVAGMGLALYQLAVYFDGEILLPVLIIVLMLAATATLMAAVRQPRGWRFAAAGVLYGLAAITRPNVLLLVPFVAGWAACCRWRDGASKARSLAAGLLLAGGVAACVAPVTIRNFLVGGDLVLIASQGGVNFYIGNNPWSDGKSAALPGARLTWGGGYEDSITMAERALGRKLSPSEVSTYWYRAGLEFLRTQPKHAVRLYLEKLRLLVDTHEVSNNQDIDFTIAWLGDLEAPLFVRLWLLAPFALAGLVLVRKNRYWWLLAGTAVCYLASFLPFFVTARYRLPALPFLMVLAAALVVTTVAGLRHRQWRTTGLRVAVLAGAALLLHGVSTPTPRVDLDAPAPGHYTFGNAFLRQGDRVAARYHFSRLLSYHEPYRSRAMLNLGRLSFLEGDRGEALRRIGAAVAANPRLLPEATSFLEAAGAPDLIPLVSRSFGPTAPYPG